MALFLKWNLLTGIVAGTAFGVQKIFGKKLGHRWRKIVWIILALRMCFPWEIPMETVWQRLFTISVSNRLPEKLVQGAVGGKKLPLAARSEWFLGLISVLMLWFLVFVLWFLFHRLHFKAGKR